MTQISQPVVYEDYIFPPRDESKGTLIDDDLARYLMRDREKAVINGFKHFVDYEGDGDELRPVKNYEDYQVQFRWCRDMFGPEDSDENPTGDWGFDGVGHYFRDVRDAIFFKLRWVG